MAEHFNLIVLENGQHKETQGAFHSLDEAQEFAAKRYPALAGAEWMKHESENSWRAFPTDNSIAHMQFDILRHV